MKIKNQFSDLNMRKKIFLDANILIELVNANNKLNKQITFLFNRVRKNKDNLYCSPTSFAITYFFLGKQIKSRQLLNEHTINFFSEFYFTRENDLIMEKVKNSKFRDLEDALQYYSAEDAGVNIIITNNYFDFEHSIIPVYHPLQYINQFLI
jgi:predicted nucleic acid-binding protein